MGEAAARQAADDGHDESVGQLGPRLEQPGDRAQQHVGRLERLDAPDEQQDGRVGRQPQPPAGGCRGTRAEQLEVDPGRHRHDPSRVGVVQLDEGFRLLVGVGDETVGGRDDLRLADLPGDRLRRVALGEGEVLDLRHRVHRVYERHVPPLGGQPGDLAGQPVVGVHEVVPARARARPRCASRPR